MTRDNLRNTEIKFSWDNSADIRVVLSFILTSQQSYYLSNLTTSAPSTTLLLHSKGLVYLGLHIRYATSFYLTALTELLAYEVCSNTVSAPTKLHPFLGSYDSNFLLTKLGLVTPTPVAKSTNTKYYQFLTLFMGKEFFLKRGVGAQPRVVKQVSELMSTSGGVLPAHFEVFLSYRVFTYCSSLPLMITTLSTNYQNNLTQTFLLYHFHQISSSHRIFLFTPLTTGAHKIGQRGNNVLNKSAQWGISISQIFSAARWLEREATELMGIQLVGMFDRRNLLLQYGETSAPLKKLYPSVGWVELYYIPVYTSLVERVLTVSE